MGLFSHQNLTTFKLSSLLSRRTQNKIRLIIDDLNDGGPFQNLVSYTGTELSPQEQAGLEVEDDNTLTFGIDAADRMLVAIQSAHTKYPYVFQLEQCPKGTHKLIVEFNEFVKRIEENHLVGPVHQLFREFVFSNRELLDDLLKKDTVDRNVFFYYLVDVGEQIIADDEQCFIDLDMLQNITTFHLPALKSHAVRNDLYEQFQKAKQTDDWIPCYSSKLVALSPEDREILGLSEFCHLEMYIDSKNRLIGQIIQEYPEINMCDSVLFILEQLPKKTFNVFSAIQSELQDYMDIIVEGDFDEDDDFDEVKEYRVTFFNICANLLRQREIFYGFMEMKKGELKSFVRSEIIPLEFSQPYHQI